MLHTGDQVTVLTTDDHGNDLPPETGVLVGIDRREDSFVVDLDRGDQVVVSVDALVV